MAIESVASGTPIPATPRARSGEPPRGEGADAINSIAAIQAPFLEDGVKLSMNRSGPTRATGFVDAADILRSMAQDVCDAGIYIDDAGQRESLFHVVRTLMDLQELYLDAAASSKLACEGEPA